MKNSSPGIAALSQPRKRVVAQVARNMLPLLAGLTALLLLMCCAGCGESEPVVPVDLNKVEHPTLPELGDTVTYAYLPQYSHSISYARHHQLVEYLANATATPLRQVFPDTFDEHVQMVLRGEIDISFSNPFTYIQLAKKGSSAFARIVEPGLGEGSPESPDFRGQLIVRADNDAINSIEDCRGKRWIAVDPSSAGGYLFALGLFHDHNIGPKDFAKLSFAPGPGGKQEKVILAVAAGQYDVGSIREGALKVVLGKLTPGQIRVLAVTPSYPGWVFSSRPGLDQDLVQSIQQAMLRLNESSRESAAIFEAAGFAGIIPAKDADYDSVRELASKLGLQ